jgi:uncharacterized protein (TIGR03083 family)
MTGHTEVIDALAGECRSLSEAVDPVPEAAFDRPTRCPAWNAKELLGHVYRAVDRIGVYLAAPHPQAPTHDAVAYFGAYDRAQGSADALDVARRGRDQADAFATSRALVEACDGHWPEVVGLAGAADPAVVVATFGPALRLDEYLKTRVLELTVHGLDLADALDLDPWATPAGLAVTGEILRALAGDDEGRVAWDAVAMVEAATGRRPVSDPAREALGPLAARLPVVG